MRNDVRTGRVVALVAVVAIAVTVSGCEKRAGLLAARRSSLAEASHPTSTTKPRPAWRLGDAMDTQPSSVLSDVTAADTTHAWAVGRDSYDPDEPDTTGLPIVRQWDGTAWSKVELPGVTWHGGLRSVAADSPTDVWAVGGNAGQDPSKTVTKVLRYDGTTWADVPLPTGTSPGTTVTDLAVADGHAWLVGEKAGTAIVLEWDGTTWRRRPLPAECTRGGTSFGGMPTFCDITGVVAFAPDDVWAAGSAAWPGFKGPLLYHWDGTRWTPVKVGLTDSPLAFSEIAGSPTDLWAVGHRAGYGGPVAAHGDGHTWKVVKGLPVARLTDLVVDHAGRPWVLENFPQPSATLATYRGGRWIDTKAPAPENTTGVSLDGITTIPGTGRMLAVGGVDLPGRPRQLQSVLLEYR